MMMMMMMTTITAMISVSGSAIRSQWCAVSAGPTPDDCLLFCSVSLFWLCVLVLPACDGKLSTSVPRNQMPSRCLVDALLYLYAGPLLMPGLYSSGSVSDITLCIALRCVVGSYPRLVPLSNALYHTCFIRGQSRKWWSRRPKHDFVGDFRR